ncbi:uncharacterized protein LOC135437119 [Drosophila montana]|uniref:uncharacterized protein LOC135437119 n=1 Tax=Drosophila montana TaxID=40370 RepID=UPI00313BC213
MNPILPDQFFARSLDRILVEDLNIPHVTWGLQSNVTLRGILTVQSLVFATIYNLSPEQEPMLEVVDKTLDGRHDLRVLFILKTREMSTPLIEQIYELFVWCWQRNFINVALTYQRITLINGSYDVHDELFSYTPFPKLRLLNVTGLGATFNWEALDVSNVQGYEFRVPVFQDVADAFVLPDGQLYGAFGMVLSSYIIHINGRLRVEETPHVNKDNYHYYTLMLATRGVIDIGVHTYTQMTLRSEQVENGLVTSYTKTCLMVPWQKEQPVNRFVRLTVRYNGILFLTLVLSLTLGWHLYARVASKGFYLALVILQLQPVNECVFRRFTNVYKILHVAFLLGAFILWNMRMGFLSAALSVKLIPPQINNLEDFLRSPLRIMVTETEVAMYFTRELLPAALQPRLLVVNSSTLMHHRDSLNTSYAYCITSRLIIFVFEKEINETY